MQFLALERDLPGVPPGTMKPWLRAEARAVWDLQQSGTIRDIWFAPGHRAVLILESPDLASATATLSTLPLVREHCIAFDVLALEPYNGYERLFGAEA